MKLRNILLSTMVCSALVFASGTNNGQKNPADTGNGQGGMDGGTTDTMQAMGTVEEFNTTDSMLILMTDDKSDTIYFDENTKMPSGQQQLSQGTKVSVRYMEQGDRKVAVEIKQENASGAKYKKTATNSNGAKEEMTKSGIIEDIKPEEGFLVIRTDTGSDTIFFDKDTKLNMSELQPGAEVTVHYKEMDGRKTATKVTLGAGNGQNGEKDKSSNGSKSKKD
jgi:cold shock CspA family protein